MGDGKGLHPDIADLESRPGTGDEVEPLHAKVRGAAPGAGRGPDGNAMTARQGGNPAQVIAMLMGDQDTLEVGSSNPEEGEPPLRFPESKAAIHHQMRVTPRHQEGIAAAAAAQGGKAHPWAHSHTPQGVA